MVGVSKVHASNQTYLRTLSGRRRSRLITTISQCDISVSLLKVLFLNSHDHSNLQMRTLIHPYKAKEKFNKGNSVVNNLYVMKNWAKKI